MRLHHFVGSSNSHRVRMAAAALGIELELVPVDLAKGEHKQPAFLKLNPNGRIPVLEDDGFILTESHAMLAYLADKTASPVAAALYPKAARARADVNRWMFWNAQHFAPAVSILSWERVIKPMIGLGAEDPKTVAEGEELFAECAQVLDAELGKRSWLALSNEQTFADFAVATPLNIAIPAKLPLAKYPNLAAWFERMQALDAWKNTIR